MSDTIIDLTIDETLLVRSEHSKGARDSAIVDLLECNSFAVEGHQGPFLLRLSISDYRLILEITDQAGIQLEKNFALAPLRRVIKDYAIICDSYFEAIHGADPRKIEAIDMGRRGIHDEGAQILEELLTQHIKTDFQTSRNFFTLVYLLQKI